MAWDLVSVFFKDGSSTTFWVDEDEDIRNAIVNLCDKDIGIDSRDVVNFSVEDYAKEPE